MRSLLATGVLVAAVTAASTAGSVAPRSGAVTVHKPTATINFGAEVAVKGKYFKPRERVTVTLSSTTISMKWTKKATATKSGRFTASFGHIALSSCNQYTLKVVGSRKSRFRTSHEVVPC